MTTARDERLALLAAAIVGALVALTPLAPATDWPQHLALATQLARLWHGDPTATALLVPNPATHNAAVHLILAALAPLLAPATAGRLLLALYPPLLMLAVLRLLRRLALPPWRALLLVPALLGFSFGWGLLNFCLGTALAWLLLDGLLAQFTAPRPRRAALLALGSLALAVTHVLALLLLCLTAAAAGAERLARRRASLAHVVRAGLLLVPGCLYDLGVYLLHIHQDTGAYSSPLEAAAGEPGWPRKLALLGALLSGLFRSNTDTALAWMAVALLAALAVRAARTRSPLLAPLALLSTLYLLIPSVFANTHLVFQRLPQWMLVAALLALPPLAVTDERVGRRAAQLLAGLYLLLLPVHLALHHQQTRGALVALAATPPGVCVTGVLDDSRTAGIRMHTLTHVAALAVPAGASDAAFSFARWMGLPVVYRVDRRPPYPTRSWEHDGRRYDPDEPLARRCPVVLARTAWAAEPTAQVQSRLFGARSARLLARSEDWMLFDTR